MTIFQNLSNITTTNHEIRDDAVDRMYGVRNRTTMRLIGPTTKATATRRINKQSVDCTRGFIDDGQ